MGAWHNTYADLLRTRFSALVAYANLLVPDPVAARELAQDAALAVFSKRRTPRGTRAAELAARDWMAAHAPDPTQAAVVLQAIDAKDAAAIKAVLRKATPDPLPEVTEEQTLAMRMRFVEASRVYAVPSGGVNTIMAPARRQHQSALVRSAFGVVGAVAAVAVAGFAAVKYLPLEGDGTASGPTASASPSLSPVTWNPEPDYKAALANFTLPKCGDEFAPAAKSVGGLTPEARANVEREPTYGTWVMLTANFVGEGDEQQGVLADPYSFVITLDDVVVFTPANEFQGLELFLTNSPVSSGGYGITRSNLCDAQEAARELELATDADDWESMTDEERAAADAAWQKFGEQWQDFPAGTYKVYYVTPMVFGEQLALGKSLATDGVQQLQALTWDISYTELSEDPRVAPYCAGSRDSGEWSCQVPPDVLKDVLTQGIDPATIDDIAPGVGISEPVVYELEAEED